MSAARDGAAYDTALLVIPDGGAPSREQAARWLRARMDGWPEHDVLRVGLIAAELLDNARRHGLPRYVLELVLDRRAGVLTIRLRNRASGSPVDWAPAAGSLIVGALSEQWGVVPLATSTTAWAKVRFDE